MPSWNDVHDGMVKKIEPDIRKGGLPDSEEKITNLFYFFCCFVGALYTQ